MHECMQAWFVFACFKSQEIEGEGVNSTGPIVDASISNWGHRVSHIHCNGNHGPFLNILASLEEHSTAALLWVSHATCDVIQLRDYVNSFCTAVFAILQKLKKVLNPTIHILLLS
ncbi:hypothetical protein HN51_002345 [Arachis hypogaea]